jgi:hypothetical protein
MPRFRYETHALFFSADAVRIETPPQRLADRRVNRVNPRREFYGALERSQEQRLDLTGFY